MGNFIPTKKKPTSKVTAIDEAILNLKIARKRLVDQKKRQELLADRAFATVQQLLKSKKSDRALIALRKRKLHEQQVLHVEGCILRIDEQLCSVETTNQQVSLVAALKSANVAIKEMQQQMKVEDVEKLMDESADAAQYLEEVQAVLGQSLVAQDDVDLEAELTALSDKMIADDIAKLPTPVQNPEGWQVPDRVPSHTADVELQNVPATPAQPAAAKELRGSADAAAEEDADLGLPDVPTTAAVPAAAATPAASEDEMRAEPLLA